MKYLQTDKIPEDLSFQLKKIAKKILRFQARRILKKYKPKVVAITGSVGKTLTKEAIYAVLSKKFFVRKSEKSFTAELGVPLAVIGCPVGTGTIVHWIQNIFFGLRILLFRTQYPEWLILEIDNDKPGDLKTVTTLLFPDILVMTAIGDIPAHIESFGSIEDFLSETSEIVSSVKKDGVIVYNVDDETVASLVRSCEIKKISCGIRNGDVSSSEFMVLYGGVKTNQTPTGMSFSISYSGEKYPITVFDSLGVQNVYSRLLAFAVACETRIEPKKTITLLNKLSPVAGRMRIIAGIHESLIIDDSYNSSPQALSHAISLFKELKTLGRKVVIVGDMLELGKYSSTEHRKIAVQLNSCADFVITVGLRTQKITEELIHLGFKQDAILSFDVSDDVGKVVSDLIKLSDVVLIKGSQAMRMEKVVEALMRHPHDKKNLLVRQGAEWKGR